MKIKVDLFVLALLGAILLAYFFPEGGREQNPIPLDLITSIGVSFIFFFYGLKLSPAKMKEGLRNWKLHVLIQATTFVLFPLIVLSFYPLVTTSESRDFFLAFLFLAALPSTVSSSVVMVSIAKANIPAAIFNASISGLIGIGLTPLWMGFFISKTQVDFNFTAIYMKLFIEIVLPVLFGLFLQRYLGNFTQRNARFLTLFDKSIIWIIVYKSFAESFDKHVFSSLSFGEISWIFLCVSALFFVIYSCIGFLSKRFNFNREDRITAQFCGTKKSLVHGTVFSKILFSGQAMGTILLPLMIFHAFQLFVISAIASKKGEN